MLYFHALLFGCMVSLSAKFAGGGHELPLPSAGASPSRKAGVCLRESRTGLQHDTAHGWSDTSAVETWLKHG